MADETQTDRPAQGKRIDSKDILPVAIKPRHLDVGAGVGDLYYSDGTNFVRLPIGTAGQVLTVSGGVPKWV